MALITPPTADEVYNEAGRNQNQDATTSKGLRPEHFGLTTDADVINIIDNEILSTVRRRVNAEADASAFPLDYPLSSDSWRLARPTFTDDQIAEEVDNQEAAFTDAIRMLSAARLIERVSTKDDYWERKAARLAEDGEMMLASAKQAVIDTVKRTTLGQDEGRAGFAIVSINSDPAPLVTEFGYPDVNIYGY